MRGTWLMALMLALPLAGAADGETTRFRTGTPIVSTRPSLLTETALAVCPAQKFRIAFTAHTTGRHTLEHNPRIRIVNPRGIACAVRLRFLDADGERLEQVDLPVLSKHPRDYVRVGYPPARATHLELHLLPAGQATLTVAALTVAANPGGIEADVLNPHPTFAYGDLNPYGFRSGYGGGFYQRPDGVTVWKTGFTGTTPAFPVDGGQFYDFYLRGIPYWGRGSYFVLQCFNAEDRRPFHTVRVGFSETGETTRLRLPETTGRVNLLCYHVILEAFKVTPAADEEGAPATARTPEP